jgi:hypothetical protein
VDDDVVEQRVGHFIATEVTSIGSGGAEFYDRENDRRLSVRGYDFAVKSLELLKPEPTDAE